MPPCRGCKDKMGEISGNFKMRFVGKPDGKLMKGAPGNYEHGKVYMCPYSWSHFKFWELLEAPPELKVPQASEPDSVYEEVYFPPEEDEPVPEPETEEPTEEKVETEPREMVHVITEKGYEKNLQKLARGDYEVDDDGLIHYPEPEPSRKELKKKLDEAGVDYNQRTRTENLRKMVDELDETQE